MLDSGKRLRALKLNYWSKDATEGGYTKYPCYLCKFDSRDKVRHYTCQKWEKRLEYVVDDANIKNDPLVKSKNILLPPLHIKLGLAKQFLKTVDPDSVAFEQLVLALPGVSEMKLRAGVVTGPDIRKLLDFSAFTFALTPDQFAAWKSFHDVCKNFLGNYKAPNYKDLVNTLLSNYHKIGANMSLKLHFLQSHIDVFPHDLALGEISDEQGERFVRIRSFTSGKKMWQYNMIIQISSGFEGDGRSIQWKMLRKNAWRLPLADDKRDQEHRIC